MSSSDKEKGILIVDRTGSKSRMPTTKQRISDQAPQDFHAFSTRGSKNPNKSSRFENRDITTLFDEVDMSSLPTKSSL